MQMENMTFPEAVRHLAAQVGMEVPEDTGPSYGEKRKRLIALCTESARFYVEKLYSPEGKQGLSYLLGRGLSPGTLKHFGLGFAPDSWDSLIHAMTAKGFTKGEMLECGLVVQNKSGGVYDRFRNRVMFPIIDIQGRVIAFGGRVMDDSKMCIRDRDVGHLVGDDIDGHGALEPGLMKGDHIHIPFGQKEKIPFGFFGEVHGEQVLAFLEHRGIGGV